MGREGEDTYGRRNFLELLSVFMSPPLFSVLHGRQELGFVDELTFLGKQEGPRVLLLGGRAWQVTHIDWQRRIAYVEATEAPGRTRWKGEGQGLGFGCRRPSSGSWPRTNVRALVPASHRADWRDSPRVPLAGSGLIRRACWPATARLSGGRSAETGRTRRWRGNWPRKRDSKVSHDSFTLTFESAVRLQDVERAIEAIRQHDVAAMRPVVDEAAIDGLKFSECLPIELATEMLERRLQDPEATRHILEEHVRFVAQRE